MRREMILALGVAISAMLGCQSGAERRAQRIEAHER